MEEKKPFDLDEVMRLLRGAVAPFPPAAMFQLAGERYDSLFEQLVACIISIRTRDEATVPIVRRLFSRAGTPGSIARLPTDEIDRLIAPSTFHRNKAAQIRRIAERTEAEFGNELPCVRATLLSFSGVGLKCANLALGVACGLPLVSVDIHVHRVTNRWGLVTTPGPDQTSGMLQELLPERYRVEINRLLVPFGKHVCTGVLPRCSSCPLLPYCRQVGVVRHR